MPQDKPSARISPDAFINGYWPSHTGPNPNEDALEAAAYAFMNTPPAFPTTGPEICTLEKYNNPDCKCSKCRPSPALSKEELDAFRPSGTAANGANQQPAKKRPEPPHSYRPGIPPEPRKGQKKCNHKFEILEYPGARTPNYIFYCVHCLDFKEKQPPRFKPLE